MHYLDPFYWYLVLAHRRMLKAELEEGERQFVASNINKHRLVQWVNLVGAVFVFLALRTVAPDQIGTVISALLAPVMVMGAAWFAISFGAVPMKLIDCSMEITFWMYVAFKLSFTTMFLCIGFITPPLLWPVLVIIYVAVDFSCALYDTADGLKAGLDDAMLRHSRAALIYYRRAGINPTAGDDKA